MPLDLSQIGVLVFGREGLSSASGEALALLGLSPSEALARERSRVEEAFAACRSGGEPSPSRLDWAAARGSLALECRAASLGDEGHAVLVVDGAAARAALLDAARLQTLERLQPGLAHDLRAPVNAFVLNLEVLRQLAGGARSSSWSQEDCLGALARELERLRERLTAFLALSSFESGETGACDLARLVERVAETVATTARHRSIGFQVVPPQVGVTVRAREGALAMALLHLLAEALYAAGEGETVSLGIADAPAERLVVGRVGGGGPAAEAQPLAARAASTLIEEEGGRLEGIDALCWSLELPLEEEESS